MTEADDDQGGPAGASLVVPRFRVTFESEDDNPSTRTLDVQGDSVRIGRHPSNDIVIEDRRVSPFHCSFTASGGALRVTDMGSQHGTWVSGLRVREVEVPGADARIALGGSLLFVSALPGVTPRALHEAGNFGRVVGRSNGMRQAFAVLSQAAAGDAPLLIEGEAGSGKTLVAQEVVRLGVRHGRPFLTVRCESLTSGRLEGEPRDAGSLASDHAPLARAFALASGGTLLLENVEDLPADAQADLLRLLETQGSDGADVRVLLTSAASLQRAVNRGFFRADLYLRLSRAAVRLPPLRERLEDLPLLIQSFFSLENSSARSWRLTSGTLLELRRREWPGNVRELFDYVNRTHEVETPERHAGTDAEDAALTSVAVPSAPASAVEEPFKEQKERLIDAFERRYLRELMTWAGGNVSRAARKAKIDRMYLHRLLARHGIVRDPQRPERG
jgi:DNA-binding NtrC family response regulator